MANQFSEQMSKRTNGELIRIVNEQRNDYQPEAVTAAENELAKRNLSHEQVSTAKQELAEKKQYVESRANEPLGKGWKFLSAMFPGLILIIFSGIFKADGYDRKARELIRWTIYGFCFYLGLVLIILILSRVS